jgi:predicted AlkP superfamily phosphohydrolase/phosphomutase
LLNRFHWAWLRTLTIGLLGAGIAAGLPAAQARQTEPAPAGPRVTPVLLFVADGGRPDLFQQYAAEGLLPAYARLEAHGAMAPDGMVPQLPSSTRPGWQAISTGAWSGTHGSVNNIYARRGQPMAASSPAGVYAPLEAQTLAEAAEAARLSVLMFDWNSSDQTEIAGPVVDYWRTYSRAGIALNYDAPREQHGAQIWGLMFERLTLSPVSGGPEAPASFSPLMGTRLRLVDVVGGVYEYAVLFYDASNDGRTNYDRARIMSGNGATLADVAAGDWAEVRLTLAAGREAGKTAGFYLKLMVLEPNLRRVKFFVTSISRVNASPPELEDYLADNFPTRAGAGGPLLWDGLIDEATFVEAADLTVSFNQRALPWLLAEYAPATHLAMVGYINTDAIQHAVTALVTPGSPVYDDANRDGLPDGLVEQRLGYLRGAYAGADQTLAAAWSAMPPDTTVVAASDHGFAATWRAVYAPHVLASAGLQPEPQTANCQASERVLAKACWVGGAAMIYMNVVGREPHGVIAPQDYEAVRQRIAAAWLGLRDEAGQPVVDAVFTAEQASAMPSGTALASMAHAEKTGDLIVFLRPPYQFDFAEGGTPLRDTTVWWGAHGHRPQAGHGLPNTNLYSTFYMAGPRVLPSAPTNVRVIDIAPTLAYLLGIPAPAQAQGRLLSEVLRDDRCRPELAPAERAVCRGVRRR